MIKEIKGIKVTFEKKNKEAFVTINLKEGLKDDAVTEAVRDLRHIGYDSNEATFDWGDTHITVYENNPNAVEDIIKHLIEALPGSLESAHYGC